MFNTGEKVVCINDEITDPEVKAFVHAFYTDWPKKGATYTIRECTLGRGVPIVEAEKEQATTRFLVYLEELMNPIDHRTINSSCPAEFGFCSSRFATLEQLGMEEKKKEEKELELAGTISYTS